ncbi:pyridoxamine 5'-phosphate oxidase family protein [Nocardia cyriacigeorgica]|uniref:Pyridoxamine 5'-phosphate oxidase n=1 Tax=Nocardia cyriacigeorgica TaxID=135487 RepID=A0A4U8VX98_9NOCA|nr:pyridoxamine 5'-phosphate oxidase family protein [Nocardia cyriacigeorgica]MBF6095652.1 pyridoxamine 5'-phosphate oxidase family protein [Nocardia cyriacigeorgica]MBF6096465.1 pyridoxamine 5'-phosphate oxidase family protein [Nocardia cyriacigeorgica]MBF6317234.1 pyridoxamine 5'-phosphate oxidase family protein [Nocardia cyriacigeorgica]MBF6428478.1 pyridoxamine 5'-phosphate oxidase family protein [Nocardia cyriacigeorgica]MBF6514212.1 pyridoxamine 5'-phosphate oxidase family protein [Nocar
MGTGTPEVKELAVNECWALLRTEQVGRLAVLVDDHPDIFPLNYAVDHGTIVFRSARGTKLSAALSDACVALEVDGYIAESHEAWSVVIKGRAEGIKEISDLMDTVDLPLFPWQGGEKNFFIRVVPTVVTGRRFPVADPEVWRTPFSGVRRSPME